MKDSPKQQIAFFEEEVKEILGKPPRYLIRWGISLYLLLFCIIIVLSATIDYPIYTRCEAVITPLNYSQSISLYAFDKIQDLQVTDGKIIKVNQPLFKIDNVAVPSSISGTVRFLKPITNGYAEVRDEEVMLINPTIQDYNLLIKVPKSSINKIKIGQRITFRIDSKIIDGIIESISSNISKDGQYLVEAKSESNNTFISGTEDIVVDILIDNKKIFYKILNL